MLNAQCGWLLSCLLITLLQQRAQANASSTTTAATSSQATSDQQQQPPSDNQTTENEGDTETGVTCYTCVNVSDNLVCNRFAIDRPCPQGEDFCHTLHIMDSRGESVVVNKKCADSSECSPHRVGCLSIDTQKVCVSCCDEMYCNISVPSNHSTAVFSDTRTKARRKAQLGQAHNSTGSTGNPNGTPSRTSPPPHLLLLVLTAFLAP